jgi:rhodanese-related sulfurtransferase
MGQLVEFIANHPLLIAGTLVSCAALMFYELRMQRRGLTQVSTAAAVRLINKGALVIDVRTPDEFQSGHILNARNIELEKLQSEADPIHKQKNKVVVTVCANGSRAGRAAALLRKAGYPSAFSLKGGLSGWRADNLPIVK